MSAAATKRRGERSTHRPRRSGAAELEARGSWLVSAALAAAMLSALALIRPIFADAHWLAPAIVVVMSVLGAAALLRTLSGSGALAALAGLAGGLAAVAVGSGTSSLAAIPAEWGGKLAEALVQLSSDTPPVRATPGVVLAVLLLVAIASMLVDALAFGAGLGVIALAPVGLLLILPIAAEVDIPVLAPEGWPVLALAGSVALTLLATAARRRQIEDASLADRGFLVDRRGFAGVLGATGVAAASLALALAATAITPPPQGLDAFSRDDASSLATNRVNPIIDLGQDLRRGAPVQVFQYATTATSGPLPYFDLVTLTRLESAGGEWSPEEFRGDVEVADGAELPPAPGAAPDAEQRRMTTGIVTQPGASAYLPIPGEARSIRGLDAAYRLDPRTGDIREDLGDAPAQNIEVTSDLPLADPARIGDAPDEIPPELADLLALPDSPATDAIRRDLDGIVDPARPRFAQALQVRDWLAATGGFEYSLTAPVDRGYDGTNVEVIAQFLDARSGYCVHFASAMAIMGRMLGIPSRVVVGFTPGTPAGVNGDGQQLYAVSSADLHSWAELYVPGMGWTPFEATPASGVGTATAVDPQAEAAAEPSAAPPSEPPSPSASSEGASEPEPEPTAAPEPAADGEAPPDGSPAASPAALLGPVLAVLGTLALLAAIAAVPLLIRRARRSRRRALALGERHEPDEPAGLAAWRETLDAARDLGHRVPAGTASGIERALAAAMARPAAEGEPPPAADAESLAALARVRAAYESAEFAPPERRADGAGPELWADVERVEGALAAAASASARRRATLLPPSVLARARRRP